MPEVALKTARDQLEEVYALIGELQDVEERLRSAIESVRETVKRPTLPGDAPREPERGDSPSEPAK